MFTILSDDEAEKRGTYFTGVGVLEVDYGPEGAGESKRPAFAMFPVRYEGFTRMAVDGETRGYDFTLEKPDSYKIDRKNEIITFEAYGRIYTIRGLKEEDGKWVSPLRASLPVEALEEILMNNMESAFTPTAPKDEDMLYAAVDETSQEVRALIYSGDTGMYTRLDGAWFKVPLTDTQLDGLEVVDIEPSFIDVYDKMSAAGEKIMRGSVIKKEQPMVAAAGESCPVATQDIKVNLANREKAIKDGGYGPLNPKEPNQLFWAEKARRWSVSPRQAKASLCGNCVMFIRTPSMLDCIKSGIEAGGSGAPNAWDAVNNAELGYCEAFDFKCAASRTCDAWVVGGPITEEETK